MQATIIKPHSPEQVEQIVSDALAIVGRLELSDGLRVVAFVESIRLLGNAVVIPDPVVGLPLTRHLAGVGA